LGINMTGVSVSFGTGVDAFAEGVFCFCAEISAADFFPDGRFCCFEHGASVSLTSIAWHLLP
jgi:hypothetical protein